jgi:tetratricopeptide (TPR) repeat protein
VARYLAFLSYSSRDRAHAEALHRKLESYRIPRRLVGQETALGPAPARLYPIFRDRDELAASGDLGRNLQEALSESRFLIVVASPAAASSQWVNEEIRTFKALHGEDRVLVLLVGGEPGASAVPGRGSEEAFPEALRHRVGADGAILDLPAEPIAADARPEGDGPRLALLKLVAGLTGLRLDDLVQREAQRRARRLTVVASASVVGMFLASALAFYANVQRLEAVAQRQVAERETAAARAATDYLIGTFELTNPATDNPRTVPLVTILERAAERAEAELSGQPDILTRIVTAVGRAYINLGLFDEAERAIMRGQRAFGLSPAQGAVALAALAESQQRRGMVPEAGETLGRATLLFAGREAASPIEAAMVAHMQGRVSLSAGRMDEALGHYDRALDFLNAAPDHEPLHRARVLQGRGGLLSDLARYDDAEADLREANRLITAQRGERHFDTGRSWYSLAINAYLSGNLDLAEARITTASGILERMLDRSNPIRADALSLRGQILQGQKRHREAARALDEALAGYRETVGEPHYLIGIAEVYRAMVASALGETEAALTHLDVARRNYDGSYGRLHPNHGDLLVHRALILASAGRSEEAQADCAAGLRILNDTLGPENSFTRELAGKCADLARFRLE